MAISRSQMQRQLQNRGGITNLSPRQNFGLGSSLKKFVRKIIPNEVSKVATAAAPFVAPFNPALAGAMAGIGSFDQSGSLSDALKRGALTYGGGQAARYIGGADFQGNPFQGNALSNFTSFSSPLGTQTGLGKMFEQRRVANIGKDLKEIGEVQGLTGSDVGGNITMAESAGSPIIEASEGAISVTGNTTEKIKENVFKRIMNDPSVSNIGNEALNAAKKAGKAIFYDKDGNLDKNVLLGTIAFTASYAEAKSLANDVGVDLTESEYDEARKAEKQEQYAADLQNFFGGRKDGGRIGFQDGSLDVEALMENIKKYPEKVNEITDFEVGIFEPSEPTDQGPFPMDNEKRDLIISMLEMGTDVDIVKQKTNASDEEMGEAIDVFKYGEAKFPIPSFDSSGKMTDDGLYKGQLKSFKADGGRIGYKSGSIPNPYAPVGMTNYGFIEDSILDFYYGGDLDSFHEAYGITTKADGGRIGLKEGTGSKKPYGRGIESAIRQIDPLQSGLNELKAGGGGIPMLGFSRLEKSFLFKNLAKLGGADRSFTMPQLYRILSNPSKFPKDAQALKAFLKIKGYQKGGDVGTAPEVPIRTNEAGVKELDYRQSGGFVPVGVKEKADDVPAMLSKNEFVLTADAVRGIGGGSVEKGSEKLYNVMKQAEQVGKA
jgi:hypothetical protein